MVVCPDKLSAACSFSSLFLCSFLDLLFLGQGVEITAVIIKNVELPANISEQMSGKTLVISSVAEQKMNQQSDMQQVKQKNRTGHGTYQA